LLRPRLGRLIRDIRRKIEGQPELEAAFEGPLSRAAQIRSQEHRQRGKLHTLGNVIEATEKLTGCGIERAYVDKGYRGHKATNPRRVFISGQVRGVFGAIKRELRRRSAIEPVIGDMKTDGHLGRCHLKGREGGAANVVLTAVGHNLRLVLAWLRLLLRLILLTLCRAFALAPAFRWAS
jgi:transposase, IS5 family